MSISYIGGEIALGGTLRNHSKDIESIHSRPFLGEGLVKVNAPNLPRTLKGSDKFGSLLQG